MAHKESDRIEPTDSYDLGDYSFSVQTTVSEDERVIQAHCSGPEGNAAKGISVPVSYKFLGWYVEANDTSADVYAILGVPKDDEGEGKRTSEDFPDGVSYSGAPIIQTRLNGNQAVHFEGASVGAAYNQSGNRINVIAASAQSGTWRNYEIHQDGQEHNVRTITPGSYTYQNKTVYFSSANIPYGGVWGTLNVPINEIENVNQEKMAWTMIYGTPVTEYGEEERLVARFAIDFSEAGGGGDDDWEDDDEDDGDPSYTLYLSVTGALSGRHNDPLNDTSYSYIPNDKETVKPYGCGGDGGHGGGGGGGASTVVIYKFGTSKAGSKEITVAAKRHGYGSGGGKGGKGGSGMILIYY